MMLAASHETEFEYLALSITFCFFPTSYTMCFIEWVIICFHPVVGMVTGMHELIDNKLIQCSGPNFH